MNTDLKPLRKSRMVSYKHYLEIKYKNMNVIDVEELIIIHIYVYVLCSIFCYFNSFGL